MNNPYSPHSPVLDASLFFGRVSELLEIQAFLNGNQSVSIVGPSKIGKTSLLRRLVQAETVSGEESRRENLFVYMGCHSLSNCQKDEVFLHIRTAMLIALHGKGLEPEPAVEAAVSKPAWSAVEAVVRKLNQGGLRVVLILDDFEQLTQNPQLDLSFYNALRSAAGRLRLVFVTTSTRPLVELTYFDPTQKILSSPFFNIFAQLFLGLLSETEARSMIRMPMKTAGRFVSVQLEDFIYQLVGGHPYALQTACSNAWEDPQDLLKIGQLTRQDLDPYFQSAWQELSPLGQKILRDPTGVLHDPAKAGPQEAGNPALRVALRDLARKCLLVQHGETYGYPSKAWEEFILAQRDDALTISTTDSST